MSEALAGYCTEISVLVHPRQLRLRDGRWADAGQEDEPYSMITRQVSLTTLHRQQKFRWLGLQGHRSGLHGVGASVVNAPGGWNRDRREGRHCGAALASAASRWVITEGRK